MLIFFRYVFLTIIGYCLIILLSSEYWCMIVIMCAAVAALIMSSSSVNGFMAYFSLLPDSKIEEQGQTPNIEKQQKQTESFSLSDKKHVINGTTNSQNRGKYLGRAPDNKVRPVRKKSKSRFEETPKPTYFEEPEEEIIDTEFIKIE